MTCDVHRVAPVVWARLGIGAAALAPLAYYGFAIASARRFARRRSVPPEGVPCGRPPAPRPVSVLKPVRGLEPDAYERYATFCRQDHPEFEILFGVADEDDPAVAVIRRLMCDWPSVPIRLICPIAGRGANAKVAVLSALAGYARHDLLVIADSDVALDGSALRDVARPFDESNVGMATCLYRGTPASASLLAELEALGISTEFAPGVIVAERLEGLRFALGAVMAVPRARLEEIGGFRALLDWCADDFELGRRVAERGYDVRLAACVVSTACVPAGPAAFFRHELRWAVTQRQARPRGWLVRTVVTQGLPWLLALAAAGAPIPVCAGYALVYLSLRTTLAATVGGILHDPTARRWWLLPLRDAVSCVVSCAALLSSRIEWRGRAFRVDHGRLVPVARAGRGDA